jgi:hypothetical protein
MRKAREAELEAHLIASLEPLSAMSAQLCVRNVGGGPALNVEISLSVRPQIIRFEKTWRHPATWNGQSEYFLLPYDNKTGPVPSLVQLADEYEELVVEIKWKNLLGKQKQQFYSFNLKAQVEGWYHAGHLLPEETIQDSLKKIAKVLDRTENHLKAIKEQLQHPISGRAMQQLDEKATLD